MTGLSWTWIAVALTVPALLGTLVAYPLWRMGQPIFGNIVGAVVIFGSAIGLIMREYVDLDRVTQACLARGTTCWPEPSSFARCAIYAFIGLVQVIILFTMSLRVEAQLRNRLSDPEWR